MTGLELLKLLPSVLKADAASNVNLVVQYAISTPAYVTISQGTCTVTEGQATNPTVTLTMSDETLVNTMTGKQAPMMAFMTGKIKAAGDLMASQKLQNVFDGDKLGALAKAA